MSSRKGSAHAPLRNHPHLYQINTWIWLEELSRSAGRRITLADVPDTEWDALANRGFDLIWLMGIWRRSPISRYLSRSEPSELSSYDAVLPGWKLEDVVGSPYSVQDYSPDPRIGTWEGLASARSKLQKRGMRLILDFVSNHTAPDHPWVSTHPEYYVRGTLEDFRRDPGAFFISERDDGHCDVVARGHDPYFPPWKDTAQINFFEPAGRKASLDQLCEIAAHCDGFRCDMAMLLLNDIFEKIWGSHVDSGKRPKTEFWDEAHALLPDTILIAEAYWGTEQRLLDLGFSFCYDKGFYDALRAGNSSDVRARLSADFGYQRRMVRFLENHDEQRAAAVFNGRLEAIGTVATTAPGMRFYHQGQFEGKRLHLPIQLGVAVSEPVDATAESFYQKILTVSDDDVFHQGQWRARVCKKDDGSTADNLVSYEWRTERNWKLVVANLAGNVSEGRIRFEEEKWPAENYMIFDVLRETSALRSGTELRENGLEIRLDGWRAHLFDIKAM